MVADEGVRPRWGLTRCTRSRPESAPPLFLVASMPVRLLGTRYSLLVLSFSLVARPLPFRSVNQPDPPTVISARHALRTLARALPIARLVSISAVAAIASSAACAATDSPSTTARAESPGETGRIEGPTPPREVVIAAPSARYVAESVTGGGSVTGTITAPASLQPGAPISTGRDSAGVRRVGPRRIGDPHGQWPRRRRRVARRHSSRQEPSTRATPRARDRQLSPHAARAGGGGEQRRQRHRATTPFRAASALSRRWRAELARERAARPGRAGDPDQSSLREAGPRRREGLGPLVADGVPRRVRPSLLRGDGPERIVHDRRRPAGPLPLEGVARADEGRRSDGGRDRRAARHE